MKIIITTLLLILTMSTIQAETLSERQLHLATLASLEAQGDINRLEPAIRKALDGGVTVNEIKEAFSQLYAYTGFPRSLNALGALAKVLEDRKPEWKEGTPWTRPEVWDDAKAALRLGAEVQTQVSGRPFNYDFCPQDDYYLKAHLFGDIFAGDQLSKADREIVTVAALSALKGVAPQFEAHKRGAVNMGNTQEQVDELCRFLSENGLSRYDAAAEACAGDWPKGEPNVNYAQFFIGDSHLAPLPPKNLQEGEKTVLPCNNVTFEPGCRNNWHIHHGARQVLICVSGKGWYQEWGKEPIPLKAGDIIDIPEGVKHWHGAAKDSWFQHIATHVAVENSKPGSEPNEWLEPVADEVYSLLPE
ncbi:MAG: carboxymuconolactone decarboxylase family protein [Bacteroidales bacterium]|nr:carboxymuconolactone decarboxylase family protein [Bacteroidales bacterium]MCM1148205.1 carboxymuconolactone decarboxylase family protein [Bacteroidales bacterium]MCM1207068.1 carboxymuconolactone decarboxylase family protein [Bacillota bacterium]MCM1510812.1 carboxymuconolactone decarboxylase family protein [Clostridium sp.]